MYHCRGCGRGADRFGRLPAWLALLALAVWDGRSASAAEPVAIFHVGNSLTDQAYGMHDIARARNHRTKFGRHMIPGAPLDWLWNHRGEGFREPGSKPADEILRDEKWDALILQPFGRAAQVSIQYGARYAAEAYKGNPECRVYVFANYPEIGKDRSKADQGGAAEGLAVFRREVNSWFFDKRCPILGFWVIASGAGFVRAPRWLANGPVWLPQGRVTRCAARARCARVFWCGGPGEQG
jgi:hypothetical protein